MFRRLPPYPRLPVATDKAHGIELAAKTDQLLIPGFALGPQLGALAAYELCELMGWRTSKRPNVNNDFDFDSRSSRIKGALHLLVEGPSNQRRFHQDPNIKSLPIRWHRSSRPYVALFANTQVPIQDRFANEYVNSTEQARLWRGDLDREIWRSAYVHEGAANSPILFRTGGNEPVCHDFQPIELGVRRIEIANIRFPTTGEKAIPIDRASTAA